MPTSEVFVFIEVKGGKVQHLIRELENIDRVRSVEIITGPYDLIVKVESETAAENLKLIMERIHGLDGIIRTHTSVVYDIE